MLSGKTVLITAGPTHEAIDPVRFIGNHSTGKMGYAIAELMASFGAEVHLVSGPTSLADVEGCKMYRVKSAAQMFATADKIFPSADITILSAAVADYTPKTVAKEKIKKDDEEFSIHLIKTVDIAKTLGAKKKSNQIMVGFALETNNEESNAKSKLRRKNLDFIVLNSLRNEGTCFGSDNNMVTIIEEGFQKSFELKTKKDVAKDIVQHIIEKLS